MMFLKILCKTFFAVLLNIIFKVIRLIPVSTTSVRVGVDIGDLHKNTIKSSFRFPLFKKYWALFTKKLETCSPNKNTLFKLHKQLEIKKPQENKHLLLILCWLFRINLDKDFEFILSKKFAGNFKSPNLSTNIKLKDVNSDNLSFSGNKDIYDTVENKMMHNTVDSVFSETNKHVSVENLFLHNTRSSTHFLTQNSELNINFRALEDFYGYLKMFGDEDRLSKYPEEVVFKSNPKIRKKERIPKNFRGGLLLNRKPLPKSNVSEEMLKHQVNTLKQVEFLLKNKALLLSKELALKDIDINAEVKSIMYSYYNPVGPYGNDTVIYNGDLVSKNKVIVQRRVNLIKDQSQIENLRTFDTKVGFFNFNTAEDEEWEYSSDVPTTGGWFTGQFYFINPFLILGFIFYSIIELFILLYVMSFFFGNPYHNVMFFLKYPLVYYYENLTAFPSANFFFFSLLFWFYVILVFILHLLQLLDEDRFEPPRLSWVYNFFKDFFFNIFILWCGLFFIFEIVSFIDLLFTRIFFIGTPGYPQILAGLFLIFYDLSSLLGAVGYFSFYLESFMHLDIKFPVFYFSDYAHLLQRYPLVQPYFIGDPYLNRPNFFLWFFDNLLNKFSVESSKVIFFSRDTRFIYQRELIQDFRKYNFIRKHLLQLNTMGQLYNRGWNGFNYRLDLQVLTDPIIPSEQVIRFDWRFKNSHTGGLYSRLFKPALRFGSTTQKEPVITLKMLSGRRRSSRYGYLDYLRTIENDSIEDKYFAWTTTTPSRYRKAANSSKLKILAHGIRKSAPAKNTRVRTYLFRPSKAKFRLLLSENLPLQTKADRNFRNSRLFFRRHFNFWSYIPGNSKPHRKSYFKPFASFQHFSGMDSLNYTKKILFLSKTSGNRIKLQSQTINPYIIRDAFFKTPISIFPTAYVNQTIPFFNNAVDTIFSKNDLLYQQNFNNNSNLNTYNKKISKLYGSLFSNEINLNTSDFSQNRNKNLQKSKNFLFNKSSSNTSSELFNKADERKKRFLRSRNNSMRTPRYQRLRKKRIKISSIPGYPFQSLKKYNFVSTFFSNFEPKYFLRPTSSFTTFSKISSLYFKRIDYRKSDFSNYNLKHNSGLLYPFGLIFSGFGKLSGVQAPFKFVNFDYYNSQNHNFFYSFMDFYLKKNQFRSLPTYNARFKHPLNGGLRYNLDFLYPMISELRLKEKIIPLDFFYEFYHIFNYKHLRLDPYEKIRNFKYSKNSCYLLDTRIQNWFSFNNVIWNDYYHFFFNRSFKTDGNGLKFCLASFNPINGPQSYKLFIGSPTLETPKIGQFFYNYIPWLQYKFKWLLYPTSTYKRFDSFRAIHQHSNKKFYFTSLLKFYQMNLFRWQQAAQIYQWNYVQSRNFIVHLFFHKYNFLKYIQGFNYSFFKEKKIDDNSIYAKNLGNNIPKQIEYFNSFFFSTLNNKQQKVDDEVTYNVLQDLFVPSFTQYDFRFFQYVIDLRRWKAMQSSYIRDWKFTNYIKYLGPLLYKEDVPSLMGFFAPFEYRNQIFVSRLKNDTLRFSVFFPKKVIDELHVNPLKRLKFPYPRVSRALSASGKRKGLPSFYAYVINRPFILNTPNYSFFSKKGKKVLHGFYPHLQKFNISTNLNLNYGTGFNDSLFLNIKNTFSDIYYGFNNFFELSSKKKRILKDKDFWLSKNYELQDIRNRISLNEHIKPGMFSKILNQLGSSYNLDVQRAFGKFYTRKNSNVLVDLDFWKKKFFLNIVAKQGAHDKRIKALLYPYIFRRFGGPKINSTRWHQGQSWMKFVVATQNVSVRPAFNTKLNTTLKPFRERTQSRISLNNVIYSNASLNTNGFERSQYSGFHRPTKVRQYGYFNFGLSGIGRLPRLSRAFFHMLFFRNKLDDFKNLKTSFLKIYLMSLPLFHKSDLQNNSSFRVFWTFLLRSKSSKKLSTQFLNRSLRYNILVNNFFENKYNPALTTLVYHPFFGSLVSYYSPMQIQNNSIVVLNNQYLNLKAFRKFIFFYDFINLLNTKMTNGYSMQKNITNNSPNDLMSGMLNSNNSFLSYGRSINADAETFLKIFFNIPFTVDFVPEREFKFGVRAFITSLKDLQSFFKMLRLYTIKRSTNDLTELILVPYYYYHSFFSKFLNFLDVKLRFFSFKFFNYFFQNSSLFTEQTSKSIIFINKSDKEMGLLNKALSNYSVLNSFQDDYFKNQKQDLFRARYFFGSFRSKLHWYYFPVQYFFSFKHLLSENFFVFLFNSLNLGFFFDFKYTTSSVVFSKISLFSGPTFFIYSFLNNLEFFLNSGRKTSSFKYKIYQSSNFLGFFNNICSKFFFLSSGDNIFVVRLQNRFLNPNFLTDIFLFRTLDYKFLKYIVTFNSFFFSLEHLSFLYKINNIINFNPHSYFIMDANNYILDFDNFITNLELNIKSIDGSGRHNRPKGVSQTLDKIFTYREYEKYRKEHHRQRFRGITPHWIQTSFKNRASFKRYYQSPDFVKSRVTKRLLNNMSKSYGSFRFKNSPRRLRHISNLVSNVDEYILRQFLNRSIFNMDDTLDSKNSSSSINFVDTTQDSYPLLNDKVFSIRQKIMRAYNYNSILRIDGDEERLNKKQAKKSIKRKNYRFDKFKRFRLFDFPFRFSVDAESLFRKPISKAANVPFSNIKNYPKDFSYIEEFLKNIDLNKPKIKTSLENIVNLEKLQKLPLKNQINEHFKNLTKKHQKSRKHLKYMIPQIGGNTKQGGSFINTRKPNKLRNIFQSYSSGNPSWNFRTQKKRKFVPTTLIQKIEHGVKKSNLKNLKYFKRKNKLLYSNQRHDSKVPHFLERKRLGGSVGFRYPQHKASLNAVTNPKYHRDSPRYLGSTRVGKRKLGFYKDGLPKTNLGGINKSSRSNYFMYDQGRQRRHKLAGKIKKHRKMYYAPNVKRFVRKYNKVLMHIPYTYSKWFTQNPRLSLNVDNSLLNLFINNQYDEFKFIYTQALFLLKRKIMYNIINLKLINYKHKILYFAPLYIKKDILTDYAGQPSFVFKFIIHVYSLLKFLQTYFSVLNLNFILHSLYSLRQEFIIFFFNNDFFFIRLLYNPQISRYKHDSIVSSDFIFFEDFYYKQTSKRILSQIAFAGHSLGGWNNPLGLIGQYIPGLNFYAKGSTFFNFNYQYPDFYSGRSFSPEILLDNNLIRQNNDLFDRNFFYNEFYVGADYRKTWHFLSFRLFSPISPFIEYERAHNLTFKNIVKRRHRRLPLASLRRVYNIYPNHISSFFSTLMVDSSTIVGHDATLPFKLKLLNYKIRANPDYRRELIHFFQKGSLNFSSNAISSFCNALKLKHISVLSEFHKRVNLASLVNNRRFALRHNVWAPFKYNYYYRFDWRTFLHKFAYNDVIGYRQYKLSSFFDLYQGQIPFSLKLRALQHLIVSQIPRFELDSRRKVPLNISSKEFNLLFFNYFKYVNENFIDPGYFQLDRKIFKYVNRKVHPFLYSFLLDKNDNSYFFKNFYNPSINYKKFLKNGKFLSATNKLSSLQIPEFFSKHKQIDPSINKSIVSRMKQQFLLTLFSLFAEKPFGFRRWFTEDFFLFELSNTSRIKIYTMRPPWFFPRYGGHVAQVAYDKYKPYNFLSRLGHSRHKVSRIFGIHTLYNIKKHKERSLNPSIWLKFDLFSRVRPSFKPFVTKFSKNFVFSKYIPSRGVSSYNFCIKSHTSFDNYFDRHPYISFSIGLASDNDLVHSESSYKEIKRRSQMLDFARSHNSSKGVKGNVLHNISRYQKNYPEFMDTYNYSSKNNKLNHKKKHPYKKLLSTISYKKPIFRKPSSRFNFESLIPNRYLKEDLRESHNQLGSRFILLFDKSFGKSSFGNHTKPLDGSSLLPRPSYEAFEDGLSLEYLRQHHPHNYSPFFGRKHNSNVLLKDANYFVNMSNPNRRAFFLNTLLLRPNNAFLKFVRSDTYSFFKNNFLNTFFSTVGSLNDFNLYRSRSYYSPNLKIVFDFNAFKQRYNLGLLFRDLSFERDFELFLFRRNNISFKLTENLDMSKKTSLLVSEFTKLKFFDYFEFFNPKNSGRSGFLIDSRFGDIYFSLEKFFFKCNPFYLLIIILDFYLFCFFSILSLFNYLHMFDFSFFYNFFNLGMNIDFFYYTKKRPVFQIFFHFGLFKEYLRFSWLFSLKFLIFNIEYYPYYFLIFSVILLMRSLSFNIQRLHSKSPFLVPYVWRFSDLKLNSYNGWFDSAWTEIKTEALSRLHELHHSNRIQLSHDHLFSLQDVKYLRKKHVLKNRKNLVEFDEPELDLSVYDNINKSDVIFSKPVTTSILKGSIAKVRSINFVTPSFIIQSSDNLKQLDSDIPSKSDIGLNQDPVVLETNSIVKKESSSFYVLYKKLLLVLKRKITFSQFLGSLKFGDFTRVFQDNKPFFYSVNYTVDDFGDEFGKLFVDTSSEFNSFINRDLRKQRMLPEDENVHFYRKPGSILHTEIMSRRYGTETDQLHYVMEFPGKFNNTYVNAFSKIYSIRNLNYNVPQTGYFSFSKNAKLPTTFEEFLIFCSYTPVEVSQMISFSKDPYNVTLNPRLNRLQELWSLFQYVVKYEYNMFNEYDTNDVKLLDKFFEEQPTLIDNFKFWVNKASTDAVDLNFFSYNFFLIKETIDDDDINFVGGDNPNESNLNDKYDLVSEFKSENPVGRIESSPLYSFFYILNVYLFLFLFFIFISFLFCFLFLFLYACMNYIIYVL